MSIYIDMFHLLGIHYMYTIIEHDEAQVRR